MVHHVLKPFTLKCNNQWFNFLFSKGVWKHTRTASVCHVLEKPLFLVSLARDVHRDIVNNGDWSIIIQLCFWKYLKESLMCRRCACVLLVDDTKGRSLSFFTLQPKSVLCDHFFTTLNRLPLAPLSPMSCPYLSIPYLFMFLSVPPLLLHTTISPPSYLFIH